MKKKTPSMRELLCKTLVFRDIFHQIARLAVQNFAKLHDGIYRDASIVYKTIHSLGIDSIFIAKVNFLDPPNLHEIK